MPNTTNAFDATHGFDFANKLDQALTHGQHFDIVGDISAANVSTCIHGYYAMKVVGFQVVVDTAGGAGTTTFALKDNANNVIGTIDFITADGNSAKKIAVLDAQYVNIPGGGNLNISVTAVQNAKAVGAHIDLFVMY